MSATTPAYPPVTTPTASSRSPSPVLDPRKPPDAQHEHDGGSTHAPGDVVIEVGPSAPRLPPSPPLTVEELGEHQHEHAFASTSREPEDEMDVVDIHAHRRDSLELEAGPRHEHEHDDDHTPKTFEIIRSKHRSHSPAPSYHKPRSSYYVGPPGAHSAFGTPQVGQIGVHDPREIVRIERDYSSGELPQFSPTFPLELEGRITATEFIETVNAINEVLISAYSLRHSAVDTLLATFTLYISTLFLTSHYEKEMGRLAQLLDALNAELYNPRGLNILWPRRCAFLFLEIDH
ncbi:hypothetical protein AURDEDRAFT_132251 [Auricularia subglabra TFB-10046 SS5]|nr:hypothetical protein AURDEDRAFT_132251 [Auricularia subglabra TFB-10046 SS5]